MMAITKTLLAIMLFLMNVTALAQVKAQDGKTYKTIKIGSQVWMAENLNVSTYRNSDSILQVQDSAAWGKLKTGAWCYYENKVENGTKYGKLYNWYAVNDPRGLAPKGWHIATDSEWVKLTNFLGSDSIAGTKMKSTNGWNDYEGNKGNGNNESGFTGLPGGGRDRSGGPFNGIGNRGIWWSSSENLESGLKLIITLPDDAWYRLLSNNFKKVLKANHDKGLGLSVRCLKD